MGKAKKGARKAKSEPHENHPINDVTEVHETEAPAVQEPTAVELVTTRKPKKETAPNVAREERSGVKRPKEGGVCAAVWAWLDENGDMKPNDMKPVADKKGWNRNNALIELYQWRKFNGIARTAAK